MARSARSCSTCSVTSPKRSRCVSAMCSAQGARSLLPRTAVTGAMVDNVSRTPSPMSPAWTMKSLPRSTSTASGRRRPWVSEMSPIRIMEVQASIGVPRQWPLRADVGTPSLLRGAPQGLHHRPASTSRRPHQPAASASTRAGRRAPASGTHGDGVPAELEDVAAPAPSRRRRRRSTPARRPARRRRAARRAAPARSSVPLAPSARITANSRARASRVAVTAANSTTRPAASVKPNRNSTARITWSSTPWTCAIEADTSIAGDVREVARQRVVEARRRAARGTRAM